MLECVVYDNGGVSYPSFNIGANFETYFLCRTCPIRYTASVLEISQAMQVQSFVLVPLSLFLRYYISALVQGGRGALQTKTYMKKGLNRYCNNRYCNNNYSISLNYQARYSLFFFSELEAEIQVMSSVYSDQDDYDALGGRKRRSMKTSFL